MRRLAGGRVDRRVEAEGEGRQEALPVRDLGVGVEDGGAEVFGRVPVRSFNLQITTRVKRAGETVVDAQRRPQAALQVVVELAAVVGDDDLRDAENRDPVPPDDFGHLRGGLLRHRRQAELLREGVGERHDVLGPGVGLERAHEVDVDAFVGLARRRDGRGDRGPGVVVIRSPLARVATPDHEVDVRRHIGPPEVAANARRGAFRPQVAAERRLVRGRHDLVAQDPGEDDTRRWLPGRTSAGWMQRKRREWSRQRRPAFAAHGGTTPQRCGTAPGPPG
jgi:hypothetical protein